MPRLNLRPSRRHVRRPKQEPQTPPADEDEAQYTLSAYGAIPVSYSLFVPSAPTPISPKRKRRSEVHEREYYYVTPPPRLSSGNSPASGHVTPTKSPSPSVEFAALPNYKNLVKRLSDLRERVKHKEERKEQEQERGDGLDEYAVDELKDADENPAALWYLEDFKAKRNQAEAADRPLRVQRPAPASWRHEEDIRARFTSQSRL